MSSSVVIAEGFEIWEKETWALEDCGGRPHRRNSRNAKQCRLFFVFSILGRPDSYDSQLPDPLSDRKSLLWLIVATQAWGRGESRRQDRSGKVRI